MNMKFFVLKRKMLSAPECSLMSAIINYYLSTLSFSFRISENVNFKKSARNYEISLELFMKIEEKKMGKRV